MTIGSSEHHPQQHAPTAVHHPRPHHHSIPREHTREHEKDVLGLRNALGSILSPKRLSTPSSHASSGTASPCPAHFGPGLVHPYHPVPSHLHTPIDPHVEAEDVSRHAVVSTIHEETNGNGHAPVRPVTPPKPSPILSRTNSSSIHPHDQQHHDHSAAPPILTTSNVHSLSAQQAQSVKESQNVPTKTADTPAELKYITENREREFAKPQQHQDQHEHPGHRGGLGAYIATLQSARAWDALVHGNMS
ncbi:hypothetical protein ACEPAF_8817 [Sanghuangporus sanghuang]